MRSGVRFANVMVAEGLAASMADPFGCCTLYWGTGPRNNRGEAARAQGFPCGSANGHIRDRRLGSAHAAVLLIPQSENEVLMSVDTTTVRRIAHLARIAVKDEEVEHLKDELNGILSFVEQLQ